MSFQWSLSLSHSGFLITTITSTRGVGVGGSWQWADCGRGRVGNRTQRSGAANDDTQSVLRQDPSVVREIFQQLLHPLPRWKRGEVFSWKAGGGGVCTGSLAMRGGGDRDGDRAVDGWRSTQFNKHHSKVRKREGRRCHSHPLSLIMWASSMMNFPSLYFWLLSNACSCRRHTRGRSNSQNYPKLRHANHACDWQTPSWLSGLLPLRNPRWNSRRIHFHKGDLSFSPSLC